ncbi:MULTISPECIES: DUF1934 domain-containing protein [unclassified Virgibacillus]|uniref:DUF1934 domain-containing protein n=1 Tax=unclassified Virgibacillus TaxID=2620237 RepID=UPI0024DE82BF|nr:DUF1934 domain-containing protein [Virgibacillus sp. LDC-1]
MKIEMRTTIDDNGQMEYNTICQLGTLQRRENIHVLLFEEVSEENAVIKNLITIQPEKVNIKRTGNVMMNQQFVERQITENVLRHPYGTIHMETYTNAISYEDTDQENGQLTIDYTVKLNGQEARKHLLELNYKKEDIA